MQCAYLHKPFKFRAYEYLSSAIYATSYGVTFKNAGMCSYAQQTYSAHIVYETESESEREKKECEWVNEKYQRNQRQMVHNEMIMDEKSVKVNGFELIFYGL